MSYEWDGAKNLANVAKHGIDFEDAIAIFDARHLVRESVRSGHGERRWVALGPVFGRLVAVVYTWRGETRRILSARRARRDEQVLYDRAP